MIVKVQMLAKDIPLNSTVTKRTGVKEYKLLDKMRIFGRKGHEENHIINAQGGVRFLCCDGDANVISGETELMWLAHPDSLISILKATPYDDPEICPTCGHWDDE